MEHDNSCGFLLKQIHDTLEKNANNFLRDMDLTFAQSTVLLTLYDMPDQQISLKELEKILHVAQSTTARIVSKMEGKGFISSFGDDSDKRIKYIRLETLGAQCCNQAKLKIEEQEENILSSLTEAERMIFLNLLQKVTNHLK